MGMAIAVAEPAAVNDHRMIEQRAVSIRRGFELLDEIREKLRMKDIDLNDFLDPIGIIAMMS